MRNGELESHPDRRTNFQIVQQYPALKPADVHDALAYAYDHLEEIEADLAADDEATVKRETLGAILADECPAG